MTPSPPTFTHPINTNRHPLLSRLLCRLLCFVPNLDACVYGGRTGYSGAEAVWHPGCHPVRRVGHDDRWGL